MLKVTEFKIFGLFGTRDVSLRIRENRIILVGPNGIGKSSVINIFYLFVSRQWSRLVDYEFVRIELVIDGNVIAAERSDITGLSAFKRISREFPPGSRVGGLVNTLIEAGELEKFLSFPRLSSDQRSRYANLLRVPAIELQSLHRSIVRRMSPDEELFSVPRVTLERALTDSLKGRILYLPTYRRIEKDIRDIFPDFEERFRQYAGAAPQLKAGRSGEHYVELVSFGMEDVKANISSKMQDIRNYSLRQYNNLSAVYLRDVIRGQADKFVPKEINSLTDEGVSDILARVSESTLSTDDKALLRGKVKEIQGKKKSEVPINDRFLAHYFTRLVAVNGDIARRETDVTTFVDVCNQYLKPSKYFSYDEINFTVKIFDERGNDLDLSVLSSGEKQIVSIFAHLYLEDARDQIVIIDEPELSLSVPWQKRFLPDVVNSERCGLLLAVTHSPFIYENSLRNNSVDLRRMAMDRD
jgi:predicted ATP-dependent endonuclease of OLD family